MLQRIPLVVKLNQLGLLAKIAKTLPLNQVVPLPGFRGFFLPTNHVMIVFDLKFRSLKGFRSVLLLPDFLDTPLLSSIFSKRKELVYFVSEKNDRMTVYDHLRRSFYSYGKFPVDIETFYSIKDLGFIPNLTPLLRARAKKAFYCHGDALFLSLNSPAHHKLFSLRPKKTFKELYLGFFNKLLRKFCD